jgi:hypothetical protein
MTEKTPKYETARTRRWRAKSDLPEEDKCRINHVEQSGCSVVMIERSSAGPGWAFTLGVFDTCGKPEILTVGLLDETAHYLLNEAASQLRQGTELSVGRHRDTLGDVECEFRPVEPKWVKHLMGWAIWYYEGEPFPVLQAIYPDLENRFPGEPDFDERFEQPLLQPGAPMTRVEEEFWASADPSSSLFDWKFSDPPHTRVFLSKAVHAKLEPITYVSHDLEDGAWQFLGDSMAGDDDEAVLSCFHHPIDEDPSLVELADLPLGWWAEREKPGAPWIRYEHEPAEEIAEES